jgi:hypothetical protein
MVDEQNPVSIDSTRKEPPNEEFPSTVAELNRANGNGKKFKLVVNRQPPSPASRNAAWLGVALAWSLGILFLFIPFAQYMTPILFLGGAYYAWTLLHRESRFRPSGHGGSP